MVDQPDSPPSADQPAVVALVRLAVVLIDPDGRITYWSRAAEELFGHRAEVAFGRTASGLLPAVEPRPEPLLPRAGGAARRCDALDTLGDLTQTGPAPWAGSMAVVDREERLRDVFWWAYPLTEPTGRGLLALAADARPLRAAAPGSRSAAGSSRSPPPPVRSAACTGSAPTSPRPGRATPARWPPCCPPAPRNAGTACSASSARPACRPSGWTPPPGSRCSRTSRHRQGRRHRPGPPVPDRTAAGRPAARRAPPGRGAAPRHRRLAPGAGQRRRFGPRPA
ncbi:PAS domain-containing protein [Kitasatospora gansuensis]